MTLTKDGRSGVISVFRRRLQLLQWLQDHPSPNGQRASIIAEESDIYTGNGRAERCFDDLKVLHRDGRIERSPGRPARWSA